jgi:hypothetical protein
VLPTVLVDLESQTQRGEFTWHRQRPPGAFLDAMQPVAQATVVRLLSPRPIFHRGSCPAEQ